MHQVAIAIAIAIAGLASGLGCSPETFLASSPRTVTASLAARPTPSSTSSSANHRWVDLRSDRDLLCARDVDGRTFCWFLNPPSSESSHLRASPRLLPSFHAVEMAVSNTYSGALVIRDTGDVLAVSEKEVVDFPWFHGAVELAASGGFLTSAVRAPLDFNCARMPTSEVRCRFGNGRQVGSRTLPDGLVSIPVEVTAITVGTAHACGIRPVTRSRTVVCWGSTVWGQLGDGTRADRWSPVPVVVRGLADVIQIDAERHSTCAVRENGSVACWGRVGGEEATVHSTPVDVPNLSDVVEVSVGESHLCARLRAGSVVCVGKNDRNQLGSATPSNDVGRSTIQGLDHVVKLAALSSGTCALRDDGSVVCWGLGLPPEVVLLPADAPRPDEPTTSK